MLVSEKTIRRIIKEQLLKEISGKAYQSLQSYKEKDREELVKKGIIKKSITSPELQYRFYKHWYPEGEKKLEDFKEKIDYEFPDSFSEEGKKIRHSGKRNLKKWWWKNHDKNLFNNLDDLKDKREKIVVLHNLFAYNTQGIGKDIDEFCQHYESIYKDLKRVQKNELSAIGIINREKRSTYEIFKELLNAETPAVSSGLLQVFFYLNPRIITHASPGDSATEKFSDYSREYFKNTKESGTRKYPMSYRGGNFDRTKEEMDYSNILDEEDLKDKKFIGEVVIGNWKIDSVWFNMSFSELLEDFKNEQKKKKDITIKEFFEENIRGLEIKNLYFFALKGLKCFDKKGNILQKEVYIRIQNDL
jgi:hypothetical protein